MSDTRMVIKTFLIPIWSTIGETWDKIYGFKKSFWAAFILFLFINFAFGILEALTKHYSIVYHTIIIITGIITTILQYGLIYLGLRRIFDLTFSYKDIFYPFKLDVLLRIFLNLLLKVLIMIAIAIIGLIHPILMVISVLVAIFVYVRLSLSAAFILEKNSGPVEALKLSWAATRSNVIRLIFLHILGTIILLLGALLFGIGLIWTLPFCILLYPIMYRKLLVNLVG